MSDHRIDALGTGSQRTDLQGRLTSEQVLACWKEARNLLFPTVAESVSPQNGVIDLNAVACPYSPMSKAMFRQSDVSQEPPFQAVLNSEALRTVVEAAQNKGVTGDGIRRTLLEQLRKNQVLAFAEYHDNPNPLREFGATMMADLARNGATHLAIEAYGDAQLRTAIAEFNRSGDIERLKLAYPASAREHGSYFRMLKSARDAGLTIVAVDKYDADKNSTQRDTAMASGVRDILGGVNPKDPTKPNKVVLWLGAYHLSDEPNSAAEQLRRAGVNIATIEGVQPSMSFETPIASVLPSLKTTTLLAGSDAPGLKEIPTGLNYFRPNKSEAAYDFHLFFKLFN